MQSDRRLGLTTHQTHSPPRFQPRAHRQGGYLYFISSHHIISDPHIPIRLAAEPTQRNSVRIIISRRTTAPAVINTVTADPTAAEATEKPRQEPHGPTGLLPPSLLNHNNARWRGRGGPRPLNRHYDAAGSPRGIIGSGRRPCTGDSLVISMVSLGWRPRLGLCSIRAMLLPVY